MGPGYPMYLELIKKIGFFMLFLTIFFAVPSILLINYSYDKIEKNLSDDDSVIGFFSFGAYLLNSESPKDFYTLDSEELSKLNRE
jgi:hypothetical protein